MTSKTRNKLYEIGNSLLSELYPDRCAVCGTLVDAGECVCADCNETFPRKPGSFSLGRTVCYNVCEYNESNKKIVFGAKDGRDFHKLSFMATEIYGLLTGYGIIGMIDVIIPVPADFFKWMKRGFNHTEKMSRHLSYLSGIDTVRAVKKIKETAEQKTLSRSERLENLKDSYAVSKRNRVRNKTVLLLDDVSTTGSTLKEISELLQRDGNKVICAVFAKTLYKDNKE